MVFVYKIALFWYQTQFFVKILHLINFYSIVVIMKCTSTTYIAVVQCMNNDFMVLIIKCTCRCTRVLVGCNKWTKAIILVWYVGGCK